MSTSDFEHLYFEATQTRKTISEVSATATSSTPLQTSNLLKI